MRREQIIINYINFILSQSFLGNHNVTLWGNMPIIYEYHYPGDYAVTLVFNYHLDNMLFGKNSFMMDLFKSFRPNHWVEREKLILELWRNYNNNEKTI